MRKSGKPASQPKADNAAGFRETPVAGRKTAAAPLTEERNARARSFVLKTPQGFYGLPSDFDLEHQLQESSFEDTQRFSPLIDDYFGFKIDYFPHFDDETKLFGPTRTFFVDINDEVIEAKFPLDRDIRAIITAFRLAFRGNRIEIIKLKRLIQASALAVALFGPVVFASMADGLPGKEIFAASGMVFVALLARIGLWFQRQKEDQLKVVVNSMGRTLATEIQARTNSLIKNLTDFLANIDREEASEDMTEVEWTHRSAWWAKMTLWNPKRIEYVEKFLQSEMQRLRFDYMRTGFWGGLAAEAVFYGLVVMSLVSLALVAAMKGLTAGVMLGAGAWVAGLVIAIYVTGVSKRSSLKLSDVVDSIGREPMGRSSRFADVELHRKIAEQIRRDKEKLRQAKLSGGYGGADIRRRPAGPPSQS